jgi:hypothetical protein
VIGRKPNIVQCQESGALWGLRRRLLLYFVWATGLVLVQAYETVLPCSRLAPMQTKHFHRKHATQVLWPILSSTASYSQAKTISRCVQKDKTLIQLQRSQVLSKSLPSPTNCWLNTALYLRNIIHAAFLIFFVFFGPVRSLCNEVERRDINYSAFWGNCQGGLSGQIRITTRFCLNKVQPSRCKPMVILTHYRRFILSGSSY